MIKIIDSRENSVDRDTNHVQKQTKKRNNGHQRMQSFLSKVPDPEGRIGEAQRLANVIDSRSMADFRNGIKFWQESKTGINKHQKSQNMSKLRQ